MHTAASDITAGFPHEVRELNLTPELKEANAELWEHLEKKNWQNKQQVNMAAKKAKKEISSAKIYISASFNNTLVTVADNEGNTLSWGSSGLSGFKGTRKATPYAATVAVDAVVQKAVSEYGIHEADVYIKGPGPGREAALRAIKAAGVTINMIADVTPMPHDGPRPKKKRRV